MTAFYPAQAARAGVSGRVILACTVGSWDALRDCEVTSEEPQDQGFGEAALRLSKRFKLAPTTRDGVAVAGGRVIVPIAFALARH